MTRKQKCGLVCFGVLFLAAVGSLIYCIAYQDDRLDGAVISTCGTAALLLRRLYWWRTGKE